MTFNSIAETLGLGVSQLFLLIGINARLTPEEFNCWLTGSIPSGNGRKKISDAVSVIIEDCRKILLIDPVDNYLKEIDPLLSKNYLDKLLLEYANEFKMELKNIANLKSNALKKAALKKAGSKKAGLMSEFR
jgi:hypothetical protein